MSAQGAFPEEPPADLKLIETLRWTSDEGFPLLDRHLARLARSASELGFRCDASIVLRRLEAAVPSAGEPAAPLRVRVLLERDGAIAIDATRFDRPKAGTVHVVALADLRLCSQDPWLRHKTTHRAHRDAARERARQERGVDEVFFTNERDEVCEGSYTTIFLPCGDLLLTPPLSAGVLPGVLRAELLATGRAVEATLDPADLARSPGFFVGNALRGLIPVRLAATRP